MPGGNLINLNSFPGDTDADILDGGGTAACAGTPGDLLHRPGESIETITVNGQGGNDDLSAKGGNGTGVAGRPGLPRPGRGAVGALTPPPDGILDDDESPFITLDGGPGDDHLQGSECGDVLIGGPGVDQIQGNGPEQPGGLSARTRRPASTRRSPAVCSVTSSTSVAMPART